MFGTLEVENNSILNSLLEKAVLTFPLQLIGDKNETYNVVWEFISWEEFTFDSREKVTTTRQNVGGHHSNLFCRFNVDP